MKKEPDWRQLACQAAIHLLLPLSDCHITNIDLRATGVMAHEHPADLDPIPAPLQSCENGEFHLTPLSSFNHWQNGDKNSTYLAGVVRLKENNKSVSK